MSLTLTERRREFADLVAARYSCRDYADTPVGRDDILYCLEAARMAPSACNRQPWEFLVLAGPQECAPAVAAYHRAWAATAPVVIVALGRHDEAWHRASDGKDHTDVDVAIAVEHLCLAATATGLATCWICNFDADALASALGLPTGVEPVAMITLGYPAAGAAPAKQRKPIQQIVRWGKYSS